MAKKLRLGAIGNGGIWEWAHADAWLANPEVEIVAVCDIIKEKAEKFAEKHNIKHVFADYKDLLKLDDLDFIDICTPNVFHSEMAVAGLNRGLHVFCEKPDAVNPVEAQKMANAAKKSGKRLMVMRNNRFIASSQFMKKYIAAGHMGEIYAGRCGWVRRRGIPGKGGWFTTKALSGGGPLIDLGVHFIDVAMWMMGNPRPVAVSGMTYCKFAKSTGADSVHSKFGTAQEGGTFDVEDLAMGFIKFDNGACLQIEFSWASNIETEGHFAELRGTKGGCTLLGGGDLKIFTEIEGTLCDIHPKFPKTNVSAHAANLNHFIDVLKGRCEPIFKPEQGVDMIKILSAIYKSASNGKEVRL